MKLEACDKAQAGMQKDAYWLWQLPLGNIAVDNIDGDLSNELKISVVSPTGSPHNFIQSGNPPITVDTRLLGDWKVIFSVSDHAG